jgi:hypothetical protein
VGLGKTEPSGEGLCAYRQFTSNGGPHHPPLVRRRKNAAEPRLMLASAAIRCLNPNVRTNTAEASILGSSRRLHLLAEISVGFSIVSQNRAQERRCFLQLTP